MRLATAHQGLTLRRIPHPHRGPRPPGRPVAAPSRQTRQSPSALRARHPARRLPLRSYTPRGGNPGGKEAKQAKTGNLRATLTSTAASETPEGRRQNTPTTNPTEGPKKPAPPGSDIKRRPAADVTPSRCPKCGSTRRAPYTGRPRIVNHSGVFAGHPYNKVIFRQTKRLDCGEWRVDREWLWESTEGQIQP